MTLTDDRELDALYEETDSLQHRKLEVLSRARRQSTEKTRAELAAIETRNLIVWARIRRRKVMMKANVRGEMVPQLPSETGLRQARWDK